MIFIGVHTYTGEYDETKDGGPLAGVLHDPRLMYLLKWYIYRLWIVLSGIM